MRDKVTMKNLKKEGKEKIKSIRKPYYQIGDGIVGLERIALSELKNDNKFKNIVTKLNNGYRELVTHLNANYLWD